MNRSAKIALLVAGAVLACVLAVCGVGLALRDWVPGLTGCEDVNKPTKGAVVTQKVRIEQMWPQLAPIQQVHWQEHEARARSCPEIGPMDYVMDGFAVITAERAGALPATTAATPPEVPDDLRPFAPADPHWLKVDGTTLLLDKASSTVYFTHTTD
ncbi:hypothetical protein ACFO1B_47050 [Dactylosporangium siamense]|uniref:Uncharacterized protein n=1 Tax=Dactylosporangium siamense TaxID=685454 RepID=A0A919PTD7_9ACTN|nr:hypothetical protein [Dactylosporangium siamense]GIG50505.1 hypothetical protein Dsi01nite_085460 [Dactylosporangium siamense]